MSHVLNVLHPGTIIGDIFTPLRTGLAYARTGFAYAQILSYAELTLAYAHHSFAYTTPLQGAPCLT